MCINVMEISRLFFIVFWLFNLLMCIKCMYICMYVSIKLMKKILINFIYMWFIFIMNVFIIYFYIFLKMVDFDCYDFVFRSKIKFLIIIDLIIIVEELDMG